MVIVSFVISRIKSKAIQVEENKQHEDDMLEGGKQNDKLMVSVGTQWDDTVINIMPVAYSDSMNKGFQMTGGLINSTINTSSKLPPIRKKLKVRKSADGTIRSAVVMSKYMQT